MKVQVEYSAQLRVRASCSAEALEMEAGAGLAQLLELIAARHGEPMREMLFRADGAVSPSVLCFVSDEQVDWRRPPALADGMTVTLMSPISGG
jgi:molybdopterin converting factor small subunit